MNGIIIYKKEDISIDYVKWLVERFKEEGISLELVLYKDFLVNGINKKVDFVINKTRDSTISYMFELNSIRVFNNSIINELSANKLKAYKHANDNNLETAQILLTNSKEKFIRKQIDGHGGDNIFLTSDGFINEENYLCQKFLDDVVGDIRFFIVGNKIINAVIRKNSKNFLHNFKKGAKVEVYNTDDFAKEHVEKFLNGIYCDFVGIDFFLLKNGQLVFNEIEDVCGSRMLSELGINNTTDEFLEHIKKFGN